MLQILKWVFGGAAIGEMILIVSDLGGPEVLLSNGYTVESLRLSIVAASCVCFLVVAMMEKASES